MRSPRGECSGYVDQTNEGKHPSLLMDQPERFYFFFPITSAPASRPAPSRTKPSPSTASTFVPLSPALPTAQKSKPAKRSTCAASPSMEGQGSKRSKFPLMTANRGTRQLSETIWANTPSAAGPIVSHPRKNGRTSSKFAPRTMQARSNPTKRTGTRPATCATSSNKSASPLPDYLHEA